jgi:hypothetical protein
VGYDVQDCSAGLVQAIQAVCSVHSTPPTRVWPLREKFSKGASVPQAARVMSGRYRLLLPSGQVR